MPDSLWVDAVELGDAIVSRILETKQSLISSSIPAAIGELIAKDAKYGQRQYQTYIPVNGGYSLNQQWTLNPDGSLLLIMYDVNMSPFWRGIFWPEKNEPPAAAEGSLPAS